MKNIKDHILLGVALNILGTIVGLLIVALIFTSYKYLSFSYFFTDVFPRHDYTTKILALCQIVNVPLFFFLLRKELYKAGRGMIFMFFVLVIVTLIYLFL
jgi:hypothetical protein